jgi:hypothetical protein
VKAFINRSFLDAHIAKRHASLNNADSKPQASPVLPPNTSVLPPAGGSPQSVELDTIRAQMKQTELRLGQEIEARKEAERKVSSRVLNLLNC